MRFVPSNNKSTSPRRRRSGLGSHGGHQPPVLARLPEIRKSVESPDSVASVDDPSVEERNFRVDSAHTVAGPSAAPIAEPVLEADSVSEQVAASTPLAVPIPKLPPMPTADFAETAAKILARLESQESLAQEDSVDSANAETLTQETQTPSPSPEPLLTENQRPIETHSTDREGLLTVEDNETPGMRRMIRVDPGIPRPGLLGQIDKEESGQDSRALENRRAARGYSAPELTELDSPWHDWIVKLGGTFIAGLLLVAAFQAWTPRTTGDYAGTDGQTNPPADFHGQDGPAPFRVASIVPPVEAPGVFETTLDAVAPPPLATGEPMFIDPSDLSSDLVPDPTTQYPDHSADALSDLEGLADLSDRSPMPEPQFEDLASDLMPAPAVNLKPEQVAPMPEDPANQTTEVAAVIENELANSGSGFADMSVHSLPPMQDAAPKGPAEATGPAMVLNDIFGPPRSNETSQGRVPNGVAGTQPITPVPPVTNGQYPQTGYAPLNPVKPTKPNTPLPTATAPVHEGQLVPKPDFSLFPQDGSGEAKSPISVQLDGTIQQFSR